MTTSVMIRNQRKFLIIPRKIILPATQSIYPITKLADESDDNVNQISNTGFSGSERTVNGVCEEAMVREENKKLNDSYCPDEDDPSILSQFFDDDGWNSDNFNHMDDASEGEKERKNIVDINDLPVPHDTLSRMINCPSLPTNSMELLLRNCQLNKQFLTARVIDLTQNTEKFETEFQ